MDIPSIHQKLALQDVAAGLDDLQSSLKEIDAALFNDLDGSFKTSLSTDDTQSSESKRNVNSNDRNKHKELEFPENNSSKKCLSKSKSFPFAAVTSPPNNSSDNDKISRTAMGDVSSNESVHQAIARSVSLPAPIVSAMKGSRAQHYGASPKLSVKWAPEVYDPPQTSLSHSVKNNKKQQRSKNRKNGKKGQKGSNSNSSSRGSGGRDKRQARKATSGSSDRYQRSFDSHDSLVNTLNEFESFDDGSSDSHCGSIFLKTSVTKVHYSATEAS